MVQAHIFYSGMVQGFGFRYTVQRFAEDLGLTGWVCNLEDGRVEILAEGPEEKIEELMTKLANHFGSCIKDKQFITQPPQMRSKNFQITYS